MENAPKTSISIEEFYSKLDKFDFNFEMSDDHNVWREGNEKLNELKSLATGKPEFEKLLSDFISGASKNIKPQPPFQEKGINIQSIKDQHKLQIQSTPTKLLTDDDLQELFGLDKPLGLGMPFVVRRDRHVLAPEIKDHTFDPKFLRRFILSSVGHEPVMLCGPKGSGKTTFVEQYHARLGLPLFSISGNVDEDQLFGRPSIVDGDIKDMDGLLSYALRHGIRVCLDEFSTIKQEVLFTLHEVMTGADVVVLKHHGINPDADPSNLFEMGSNLIVRHPWFRLFATDNTGGRKAGGAMYNGAQRINSATRSRITYLNHNYVSPEVEKEILLAKAKKHWRISLIDGVDKGDILKELSGVIDGIIELANLVRSAVNVGELSETLSLRETASWVDKYLAYSCSGMDSVLGASFEDSVYSGLTEETQAFVSEAFLETFSLDFAPSE